MIHISKPYEEYNYYGFVDSSDVKLNNIETFINMIGDNNVICNQLVKIINKIVSSVIKGAGKKDHMWLTIRSSMPNDSFNEKKMAYRW